MDIQTAWLKPPTQIGGLDHLAVQAPCINIYGRLLPGITNVTDRARYYSFYPWLIWALEKHGYTKFDDTFIDLFRRADCLLTHIADRHAQTTKTDRNPHAVAMTGIANLAMQLDQVRAGKTIQLSEYAHRDESRKKYFKNKLGGLGQYYLGILCELNILDGTVGAGVKYTNQFGKVMAEAMDNYVPRDLFISTIEEDIVTPSRLDKLSAFCPCQLTHSPEEHSLLCDLFFVKGWYEDDKDMLPRRRTLQSILYLADSLAEQNASIDLDQFRACIYSGFLPNTDKWDLPERLQQNRNKWAIYQRNELLSIASQGIFYAILDAYDESGLQTESVEGLCQWFVDTPEVKKLTELYGFASSYQQLKGDSNKWLPSLSDWLNPNHEIQLAAQVVKLCGPNKNENIRAELIKSSLNIFLALASRQETIEGYGEFIFTGNYFDYYPINLRSFLFANNNEWKNLSLKEWIIWICSHWGINAHFRIALRKLRGQSQSTFRIRPNDWGLEVIDIPWAANTSPRFHQALRILKDIGALVQQNDCWQTSPLGQQLKEISDA